MTHRTLRQRWSDAPRWKWAVVVVVLLSIAAAGQTKPTTRSAEAPIAVVPSMTSQDITLWARLNDSQRFQLATDCRAQLIAQARQNASAGDGDGDEYGDSAAQIAAVTPARLVAGVASFVANEGQPGMDDITDACAMAIYDYDTQQASVQDNQGYAAMQSAAAKQNGFNTNIQHHTFQATDANLRWYVNADSPDTNTVRSISCRQRTTCVVALNEDNPTDIPILRTIDGGGDGSLDGQLLQPLRDVFQAIFGDAMMQHASVTSWIAMQSVGGMSIPWPALTISCDRAAANQIDWQRVSPAGLQQLCSFSLLPQGSPN